MRRSAIQGRPVLAKKAERGDRLAAACVVALALDCEGDAPDERIEIERHAMRTQFGTLVLLFMPAPEDLPQLEGKVVPAYVNRL